MGKGLNPFISKHNDLDWIPLFMAEPFLPSSYLVAPNMKEKPVGGLRAYCVCLNPSTNCSQAEYWPDLSTTWACFCLVVVYHQGCFPEEKSGGRALWSTLCLLPFHWPWAEQVIFKAASFHCVFLHRVSTVL